MEKEEFLGSTLRRLETIQLGDEDFRQHAFLVSTLVDMMYEICPIAVSRAPLTIRSDLVYAVMRYNAELVEFPNLPPEEMLQTITEVLLRREQAFIAAGHKITKRSRIHSALIRTYKYVRGLVPW